MDQKMVPPFGDKQISRVQSRSELDYVKSGVIYRGGGSAAVLVTSSGDLNGVKESHAPGTVAFTAGFNDAWQLNASGTWVKFI